MKIETKFNIGDRAVLTPISFYRGAIHKINAIMINENGVMYALDGWSGGWHKEDNFLTVEMGKERYLEDLEKQYLDDCHNADEIFKEE